MVYGEVGKLPLQVTVDKQLISYWLRLLNKDQSTLAHIIYIILLNLFVRDEYKVKWLCRVKNIIGSCGLIKTKLILNSLNKYYIKVTGDEYHYILICPYFRLKRELYIKPYYYRRPSMSKFEQLFSSKNKRTLSKLAKYITLIMKQF